MTGYYLIHKSKFGNLKITSNDLAITGLTWVKRLPAKKTSKVVPKILREADRQLRAYFEGKIKKFDLKLELKGTEFQEKVWKKLQKIPYGNLISYKDLAIGVGSPKAYRAVGMANNENLIPIIIPCHRVIGSNGSLVGYAGGLKFKENLINLEKSNT